MKGRKKDYQGANSQCCLMKSLHDLRTSQQNLLRAGLMLLRTVPHCKKKAAPNKETAS